MQKMLKNKKGVVEQLGAIGVGVAALCITLVVVFLIMASLASNTLVVADANATAAVAALQASADDIPGFVPIIIIAIIGGLLLSLVALFQARRR